MKDTEEVLRICNEFLSIPSVIGHETPFLRYLEEKIRQLGYSTLLKEDHLIINPYTEKSGLLFSVHVDRHGFIRKQDNSIEYIAFDMKKKKGIKFKREEIEEDEKELVEELSKHLPHFQVTLLKEYLRFKSAEHDLKFTRQGGESFFEKVGLRYTGENIVSYNEKTGNKINEFRITRHDISPEKKKVNFEVDKPLSNNDKIFMLKPFLKIDNDKFYGQIDNVISAAVIYYFLKNYEVSSEIIFTTKEETGESYEQVLDYFNKGKKDMRLAVLDTSPYGDLTEREKGFITLRKGDERHGYDSVLVEEIREKLANKKISFDFKPSFIGRTELGKVSEMTKGKVTGLTLQLPTTNYHSNYETATLKSLENYMEAIEILVKKEL